MVCGVCMVVCIGFFVQLASATQAQKTAIFGVVLLSGYLPLPMPNNRLKRRFSCKYEASANAVSNRKHPVQLIRWALAG